MIRTMQGLAGMAFLTACLGLTPSAQAFHWYHNLPPVEWDLTHSGLDIRVGAGAMGWRQQLQPWWTYFPYEPNLMVQPQTTPYPPWPTNHPGAAGAAQYGRPVAPHAYYPAPPVYGMPTTIYPAGGVPSYWYGR
jgi:hypothetical protein